MNAFVTARPLELQATSPAGLQILKGKVTSPEFQRITCLVFTHVLNSYNTTKPQFYPFLPYLIAKLCLYFFSANV